MNGAAPTAIKPRHLSAATRPFAPAIDAARQQLCAIPESPRVRVQHVGALMAWTPMLHHDKARLVAEFGCVTTALWLARELRSHRVALRADDAVVEIFEPQQILRRYGYRDGRWVFAPGTQAGIGIARGAIHGSAQLSRAGLRISCPSSAAMLTLVAVLGRLEVDARASDVTQRVLVSQAEVSKLLVRLGIPDIAAHYGRLLANDLEGSSPS